SICLARFPNPRQRRGRLNTQTGLPFPQITEAQNHEAMDFFDAAIKSGKDFDMNEFTNKKWVKNTGILIRSSWGGYLDLTNPKRREIFENYLNKSK
ncbi:MAG: hypothetical protein Q7U47_12535, partial [Paludibacter sp.]|nr:hypothetical protein [Paludibacter sp.]